MTRMDVTELAEPQRKDSKEAVHGCLPGPWAEWVESDQEERRKNTFPKARKIRG